MTVALMFSRGKGLLAQIHQHGVLFQIFQELVRAFLLVGHGDVAVDIGQTPSRLFNFYFIAAASQ